MARLRPRVVASTLLAWGIAVLWALPFLGLVMVSLRPYSEVIIQGWWSLGGARFTLDNFAEAWSSPMYSVQRGYVNSLIVTVPSTIIPIAIAALAAYSFSRFSFPLKNYLFIALLLVMSIPQQMTVIPLFFMLKDMNLLDRLTGLILVHSAWGLAWITFFLKNFFDALPREVEEAARVDGAGDLSIFVRVVLPMSLPALASVAAIQFTWVWSDFFYALMFLVSPDNYVVTLQVGTMKGQYHLDWGLLAAGSIFALLVPLLIYAGLQKYYVRGMTGWTVKG